MKVNHELIRKFIRVFGISLFGIICFLKFKKLIEAGGKEIDPEKIEVTNKSVDPSTTSLDDDNYYDDDDDD